MRLALDTNVLVYAEGVDGPERQQQALAILERLPYDGTFLPVQALGELYNVLVRKARRSRVEARLKILSWRDAFRLIETSVPIMLSAADLAADHQLMIWDAVILSAAADAECRLLLSEDLHDGFTWGGVSVTNPFALTLHPLLEAALNPIA